MTDYDDMLDRSETRPRFFYGRVGMGYIVFLSTSRIEPPVSLDDLRVAIEDTRRRLVDDFPKTKAARKKLVRDRLYQCLQLLHEPVICEKANETGEPLDLLATGYEVEFLHKLEPAYDEVGDLARRFGQLEESWERLQESGNDPDLAVRSGALLSDCRRHLLSLKEKLTGVPDPEGCEDGVHRYMDEISVGVIPDPDDDELIRGMSRTCIHRVYSRVFTTSQNLAKTAARAEGLAGFPELPLPPGFTFDAYMHKRDL